jgi:hypothetical protein
VDQIAKGGSYSGGHMFKGMNASADDKPRFGKQSLYVDFPLDFVDGSFRDTEPGTQPAPQGGRYEKLPTPPAEAFPFGGVWLPPKSGADRTRRFQENAMSVQGLDYHCGRIPPPWMQPIRQQAHRMPTNQTEEASHPDDDPSGFRQTADLARIHPVSYDLQHALGVPRGLPAENTKCRTNNAQRWGIGVPRAQLLDTSCQAV